MCCVPQNAQFQMDFCSFMSRLARMFTKTRNTYSSAPFQYCRIRHWLYDIANMLLWDDVTYTVSDNSAKSYSWHKHWKKDKNSGHRVTRSTMRPRTLYAKAQIPLGTSHHDVAYKFWHIKSRYVLCRTCLNTHTHTHSGAAQLNM